MPAVSLNCPNCRGVFPVDDPLGGREVVCPLCRAAMIVPAIPASHAPSAPKEAAADAQVLDDPPPPPFPPPPFPSPPFPSPSAASSILIPTTDGGYVAVHEPMKTVGSGSLARQVRRLSPEERAHRRFWRNVILIVVGAVVLVTALLVLVNLR
jgi:hypothetical protein